MLVHATARGAGLGRILVDLSSPESSKLCVCVCVTNSLISWGVRMCATSSVLSWGVDTNVVYGSLVVLCGFQCLWMLHMEKAPGGLSVGPRCTFQVLLDCK